MIATGRRTSVVYQKLSFLAKLEELGADPEIAFGICGRLPDRFTFDDLAVVLPNLDLPTSYPASAFETTGGASMSCGRLRTAWDTLSRTSLAASSRFLSRLNSMVIKLEPWELREEILRMPSMELMAFSSGSVICD